MKEILKDSLCYLIGAIDHAADQGVGWRQHLINLCSDAGLKIKFLDPTNKITGLQKEIGKEQIKIKDLKNNARWDELSDMMHTIVREDHRCVDISDFVIFMIDPAVHTCGSYFEFQSALTQHKPYFIVVPGGKKNTPHWLFGICDHNCMYGSVEEAVDVLSKLNDGSIPLSDRWVLIRQQLNQL